MSLISSQLEDAIARAVHFLSLSQLPYGEFSSYRFADPLLTTGRQFDSSPFTTCFVLYALGFVRDPTVNPLILKGISFLVEEREDPGVWRYWSSRNTNRIDPDLDDTCCAAFELKRLAPECGPPCNELVILSNRDANGLFKTWLRQPHAKNDIDAVVNANVLLYLGERPETTLACNALNQLINKNREKNNYWYYLDNLALYYMISRAYFHEVRGLGKSREAIVQKTLARQGPDGSFGNEILTALALCTFLNYGLADNAVERAASYLVKTQHQNGSWQPCPFYGGPEPPTPHNVWWGSGELTTAFCLESLARSLTI